VCPANTDFVKKAAGSAPAAFGMWRRWAFAGHRIFLHCRFGIFACGWENYTGKGTFVTVLELQ
jgi:hypothetical protein